MTPEQLFDYSSRAVDDAGSPLQVEDLKGRKDVTFVGFQCGFEPLVVGVVSCLPGCTVPADEACELAIDLLLETGWFKDESNISPSFVYTPQELYLQEKSA